MGLCAVALSPSADGKAWTAALPPADTCGTSRRHCGPDGQLERACTSRVSDDNSRWTFIGILRCNMHSYTAPAGMSHCWASL